MCLVNVYIKNGNKKEEFLREAAFLGVKGDNLTFKTLFGKEKSIKAKIEEIDFANSRVLLDRKKKA
ncbi:hypothetical protein AKJ43_02320 [candidate division MSBL1 archaeon SCGC-AAA261D19]|uniref:Uncharacterized protein n=1 Tax=candidate division MSBL1 archaeon SCGC-AAA261D19 TaxID=1698273 RepID=A0A133V6V5_9EURY|nr:hypothetical protein AKJ43_02320 [candidate division MSBL1 archaeon SCGC-AAA261D19]